MGAPRAGPPEGSGSEEESFSYRPPGSLTGLPRPGPPAAGPQEEEPLLSPADDAADGWSALRGELATQLRLSPPLSLARCAFAGAGSLQAGGCRGGCPEARGSAGGPGIFMPSQQMIQFLFLPLRLRSSPQLGQLCPGPHHHWLCGAAGRAGAVGGGAQKGGVPGWGRHIVCLSSC